MFSALPATDSSLLVVTVVAAACDLRSGRISDWLTLPALLAGVAVHGWTGGAGAGNGGQRAGLARGLVA